MASLYRVKVPATSANLGSGFDTLGMAVSLYNEIEFELLDGTDHLEITIEGFGKDEGYNTKENLIYKAYSYPFIKANNKAPSIRIKAINQIPFARGLGSSSAAIVIGLVAAQVASNFSYSIDELLALASELDHHPDNVAPALLGGIVISRLNEDRVIYKKIAPPKNLKILAIIPNYELSTSLARSVLPESYQKEAVIKNLGAISLLVAAFLTEDLSLITYGLEDKLHEPYRESLIPELALIRTQAKKDKALGTIISGAGSTMLLFYDEDFLLENFKNYCKNHIKNAMILDIEPLNEGAQLFKDESELKLCP